MDRLLPAVDLRGHFGLGQRQLHLLAHPLDQVAPVAAGLADRLRQRRMAPGTQEAERGLLQFAIALVQTEPVRDRRVDLERLARDAGTLVRRHRLHRAHVVHAVGELDQDDAHVARHRQQHLAEGFGLRFLAGRELQLVELGQAVDDVGGGCAEALDHLRLGDAAVLHRVVHQRGHDGLHVELPVGAQAGHRDRVRDVGLAAGAELAQMRLVGEAVGLAHAAHVGLVEVVELGGQHREGGGAGAVCARHRIDHRLAGAIARLLACGSVGPDGLGDRRGLGIGKEGLGGMLRIARSGLASRPSPGREEHATQDISSTGHHDSL